MGCLGLLSFEAGQTVHKLPLAVVEHLRVYLSDLGVGMSQQLGGRPQVFQIVVGVGPKGVAGAVPCDVLADSGMAHPVLQSLVAGCRAWQVEDVLVGFTLAHQSHNVGTERNAVGAFCLCLLERHHAALSVNIAVAQLFHVAVPQPREEREEERPAHVLALSVEMALHKLCYLLRSQNIFLQPSLVLNVCRDTIAWVLDKEAFLGGRRHHFFPPPGRA